MNDCAKNFVNLQAYPVDRLDSIDGETFVSYCQSQLHDTGSCLLPDFLLPEAVEQTIKEVNKLVTSAHQVDHYFSYDDVDDQSLSQSRNDLPDDHPRRYKSLTKIRFVAQDLLAPDNPVLSIHRWPHLSQLVGKVMRMQSAYPFDCPLSGCVFTVAEAGELQDWHFDGIDFIITLMLEDADSGGGFEYVPGLRSPDGQDDYENISRVLSGESELVRKLAIRPGTLTMFKGKYNLHRAAPVGPDSRRVMAVLSFSEQPGLKGSNEFLKLFYGRSLEDL